MNHSKTIVILFHQRNNARNIRSYSIVYSARLWREQGHKVIFLYGTDHFVPADICFVHLDLSVVPDEYLEFSARYPIVVNGQIADIRKSSFSKNLVHKGDAYSDPVIVKTDLNYAGWPERFLFYPRFVQALIRLSGYLPGSPAGPITSHDYRVYECMSEVPDIIWNDSRYVVEKFLPEREGDIYYSHCYLFMGNSFICNRKGCLSPIVKDRGLISEENVEPHKNVIEVRQKLGLGYGKLDYCIHDGEMILLDINKTFTYSLPDGREEVVADIFDRENALDSFFT